jgi:hypothetical protein
MVAGDERHIVFQVRIAVEIGIYRDEIQIAGKTTVGEMMNSPVSMLAAEGIQEALARLQEAMRKDG